MINEPRLEQYLAALDKALGPISVSDRAEIITEIKSHILDAVERNPNQSINAILESLGDAESEANRYLLERGFKPGKPAKAPMVKWLTIGFLGTVGMILLFIVFIIWKFSPILKVDEETERVTILGGLIDVDGKMSGDKLKLSDIEIKNKSDKGFEGEKDLKESKVELIEINFRNGIFDIHQSVDSTFKWNCRVSVAKNAKDANVKVNETVHKIQLNFKKNISSNCKLIIPAKQKLVIMGINGNLNIENPDFSIDASIINGNVFFYYLKSKKYIFETESINGEIMGLASSSDKAAIPIKIQITNGKIIGKNE